MGGTEGPVLVGEGKCTGGIVGAKGSIGRRKGLRISGGTGEGGVGDGCKGGISTSRLGMVCECSEKAGR